MTQDSAPPEQQRSPARHRLSAILMGAGVATILAAAVLFVLTIIGVTDGEDSYSGPGTFTAFGDLDDALTPQLTSNLGPATVVTPTQVAPPTPTAAAPPPSDAPIDRILIPRFDVDAPVVVRGVGEDGIMETPSGPSDVAWYDFTARPGLGSNAVFSGHVDYVNVGPAVFWHAKDLEQGDLVEVRLADDTLYQYRVVAKEQIDAATADVMKIVGATPREVVTLITCGGNFNRSTRQYDQRVIVRAERISDEAEDIAAPDDDSPAPKPSVAP